MNKTIYVVMAEQEEGGWGFPDFEAEAYTNQKEAENRAAILNKEKENFCGYYFAVIPAKLKVDIRA